MSSPNSTSPPTTPSLQPELSAPEEPLFTEINIPLPALPASPSPSPSKPRHRSISLSSLSFHRHDSSSSHTSHQSPSHTHTAKPDEKRAAGLATIKEHQTSALRSRTQTLGALAVAPAVLMLSAELFTPGSGG
ncbi:uncharacterized protein BDZ99DRAFT_524759 [Mytilinidion resinicola]|uniref:Uncharacterized protein n=1 Tax=Mytilinidion resinicola TaxID=574789 RepID=A0A6A6Y909_9PEZI|nr:uncharacterized protein BDZ99DRAFT_524759 [Mytilinidion resinicola]KAF2805033.1 hypothetical protein BDZ99DRAFT_524759 [Mytilinidion resinicola]